MKNPKTLLFIIGLFVQTCLSEKIETTKHGHSNDGKDKKVSKRDYYAPEYNHDQQNSYPASYRFEYGVHDPQTGDIKKQYEERDGDTVRGYYSLMEPDGSIRLVEYTADSKNGFQATVTKMGHTHHPTSVTHHMNTAAGLHDGGVGSYAPNYHGGDHYDHNKVTFAPSSWHGDNNDGHHYYQRPAANGHYEPAAPAYNGHHEPAAPTYNGHYEPAVPAYHGHHEPTAPAYHGHHEPTAPAYNGHHVPPPHSFENHYNLPQHHQQQPPPSAYNHYEPPLHVVPALNHYQQQQPPPSSAYNDHYERPVVPASYERPIVPASYERPIVPAPYERPIVPAPYDEPGAASPETADFEHGSQPLFAGALPTAHGDYGSASPEQYYPAPLQFPAVASQEDNFDHWSLRDDDHQRLHRIDADGFQFPAAQDGDGAGHVVAAAAGPPAKGGSAERPEYLRKYFEPGYRGNAAVNSFYEDDDQSK